MSHIAEVFLTLFIVFVAAQVGAEVAQRLKLPAVVGEITAGCIVGPSVLGWVHVSEPLEVLAEIGAILLLFSVGLETRVDDLSRLGRAALMVGLGGVVAPFALGVAWAVFSGYDTPRALFLGAAFVATSAGITARVLQEMNVLDQMFSRVILGAAVIDDILAMLLLAVVTAMQQGGGLDWIALLLILAQAIAFVVLIALVGSRVMRRSSNWLEAPINPLSPLTILLALCLGLAVAASYLGLAAIIGAFLAGVVAAETEQRETLVKQLKPIMAFLVPFFFVVTGAKVNLADLANVPALVGLGIATALAIIGKLIGGGLGAWSLGRKPAILIATGMVPRGEVGIIVASLGQEAGIFTGATYAIIIGMSLLTSVIAPPVLAALLKRPIHGEPTPIEP